MRGVFRFRTELLQNERKAGYLDVYTREKQLFAQLAFAFYRNAALARAEEVVHGRRLIGTMRTALRMLREAAGERALRRKMLFSHFRQFCAERDQKTESERSAFVRYVTNLKKKVFTALNSKLDQTLAQEVMLEALARVNVQRAGFNVVVRGTLIRVRDQVRAESFSDQRTLHMACQKMVDVMGWHGCCAEKVHKIDDTYHAQEAFRCISFSHRVIADAIPRLRFLQVCRQQRNALKNIMISTYAHLNQ